MPKKPCFRGPLDRQQSKWVNTLLHAYWQHPDRPFLNFFFAFLKAILNFKHLPKKDDPRSWCISGNTGSEKYGWINV